ncbi:hypothetical protein BGZ82_003117 [Podila clonocystis]|nr:hypothetical protein BGZ82_003117 [Podila clonocystis]
MAQTREPLHVDATVGRNSNPSPSSMDSLDLTSAATSVSGDNNSLLLHHQQQHLLKDHQRPEGDDEDDDENEQFVIVRALYPFETKDPTSLSFEKDALIQVLTQLESGWWYGFCNDERGWFPSNYVQEISEDELEHELELAMHQSHPDDTDNEARSNDDGDDLWLPQTTSEGQVFYYNTRTGESSWTIPAAEGHMSDDYRDSENGFEGEGEGEGEGEDDRSIPTGHHEMDAWDTQEFILGQGHM